MLVLGLKKVLNVLFVIFFYVFMTYFISLYFWSHLHLHINISMHHSVLEQAVFSFAFGIANSIYEIFIALHFYSFFVQIF